MSIPVKIKLSLNINPEAASALYKAADATGRTISQLAEYAFQFGLGVEPDPVVEGQARSHYWYKGDQHFVTSCEHCDCYRRKLYHTEKLAKKLGLADEADPNYKEGFTYVYSTSPRRLIWKTEQPVCKRA